MRLLRVAALCSSCLLGPATVALPQTIFPLTVDGKSASATIALPGGLGIDLSIAFEEVVGLHPGALAVSARVVSPFDLNLLSRLPGGFLASLVPTALPVVVRIEPTEDSALAMSGVVTVTLHTHNLALDLLAPFGLYTASAGGPFREMTRTVSMGSYRVDGSGGGFSEFVIALDNRPVDTVINEKFASLDDLLLEHGASISATLLPVLQDRVLQARLAFAAGATQAAIGDITSFGEIVRAQSGKAIPDVWRANDPRPNVAGLLRSAADTLTFSLRVKANRLK
jgi:hypothetical protein